MVTWKPRLYKMSPELRLHSAPPSPKTELATQAPFLFLGRGCSLFIYLPRDFGHAPKASQAGKGNNLYNLKDSIVQRGTNRINVWTVGVQNQCPEQGYPEMVLRVQHGGGRRSRPPTNGVSRRKSVAEVSGRWKGGC